MLLITGAAGFIGLNFLNRMLSQKRDVVIFDKFTYAANIQEFLNCRVPYVQVDIANREELQTAFSKYRITEIVHFAAESHVDNSIKNCMPFVQSNVLGTVNMLDMALKYEVKRFIHISTDEVFGSLYGGPNTKFDESSASNPSNPYSASKAAAEQFVRVYGNTYGLPYCIINMSNNYGPYQHKEKFIPLVINNILNNKKIPVYGHGYQIRDWLFVEDACEAIDLILSNEIILSTKFLIGGNCPMTNNELVRLILDKMSASYDLIEHVTDRIGHDMRYESDTRLAKMLLGWQPKTSLSDGLDKTIAWNKKVAHILW